MQYLDLYNCISAGQPIAALAWDLQRCGTRYPKKSPKAEMGVPCYPALQLPQLLSLIPVRKHEVILTERHTDYNKIISQCMHYTVILSWRVVGSVESSFLERHC